MKRWLVLLLFTSTASAFDPGRAGFPVRVRDDIVPYNVFAIFELPRERFEIKALRADEAVTLKAGAGQPERIAAGTWRMTAPARAGVFEIGLQSGNRHMQLNIVVMHPATDIANGRLNGYRIGAYPKRPLRGDPIYLPPKGFIELNEQTASLQLSPHFRLSQFPAKQAGGYPKYLVLRERLLLKLELLLEKVNAQGFPADSLTIMSGYRTPFYNAAIKNVPYSRHVYGGAADIFVDVNPRDGIMDDLNRDGKTNQADAQLLYRWASALYGRDEHRRYRGGLGVYRSTPAHGPFLHVDARGTPARWGLLP